MNEPGASRLGYIEDAFEAGTTLTGIFSILQMTCHAWPVAVQPGSEECNG